MKKPILLAEDLEDDALVIQRVLKKAGVINPIIVVPDGEEAILYLQGEGTYADRAKFPLPGVLLLDLKMPKRGGMEVLEWCQTQPQLKEMLIVVLTGLHETNLMQRAYAMGGEFVSGEAVQPGGHRQLDENFWRLLGGGGGVGSGITTGGWKAARTRTLESVRYGQTGMSAPCAEGWSLAGARLSGLKSAPRGGGLKAGLSGWRWKVTLAAMKMSHRPL